VSAPAFGCLPALAQTLAGTAPVDVDAFLASQHRAGLLHGERPLCRVLSPLVVRHDVWAQVCTASELVVSAAERLVTHALVDPALARLLGVTATERALFAIEPGYAGALVIARLDMVFVAPAADRADAAFAFLELNADSPAGITDQSAVEATLHALPPVEAALATCPAAPVASIPALLDALAATFRAWGGTSVPRIALVDWPGVDTNAEQELLRRALDAQGMPAILTTPDALRWDGVRLSADGAPIDLVYRRLITQELQARLDDDHPLLAAARAGGVCLANPLRSSLANRKSAFAALSDPAWAHLFTADERRALRAHVPWTRGLGLGGDDAALCAEARRRRAELVVKPNEDYGGHGVVLGWTVSDAEWEAALARGVAEGAVLQERVAAQRLRFPTLGRDGVAWEELGFDLNPFLFRGRVAGAMVRVSDGPLSNVSAGGGVTGLLVLRDGEDEPAHV
jgi:hypothetical protein